MIIVKSMNNKRMTVKERNLVKGAVRRVFSRSDLRRSVADDAEVKHSDPRRPRVKKWAKCAKCGSVFPKYLGEVDHVLPIVPLDKALEDLSWDELINNLWCDKKYLQFLDESCHIEKTKEERKLRDKYRKERKLKNVG